MTNSETILDPICGMVVDIASARDQGLSLEMPDREYAFCSPGCLAKFARSPERYRADVHAWLASNSREQPHAATAPHHAARTHADEVPVIDEGMREWYKACRCCLSEAYPKVVEQLDAEKVP